MALTMTESEAQLIIPGPVPTSIVHDELMEGLVHAGRALQRPAQSDVGGCGGKDAT